jgi:hypothetical protein
MKPEVFRIKCLRREGVARRTVLVYVGKEETVTTASISLFHSLNKSVEVLVRINIMLCPRMAWRLTGER